eukprot:917742-Lingulodinium_polyedra.AAC.1
METTEIMGWRCSWRKFEAETPNREAINKKFQRLSKHYRDVPLPDATRAGPRQTEEDRAAGKRRKVENAKFQTQ